MSTGKEASMTNTINNLRANESAWLVGQHFEGTICFDGKHYTVDVYYPIETSAFNLTKPELFQYIVNLGYRK